MTASSEGFHDPAEEIVYTIIHQPQEENSILLPDGTRMQASLISVREIVMSLLAFINHQDFNSTKPIELERLAGFIYFGEISTNVMTLGQAKEKIVRTIAAANVYLARTPNRWVIQKTIVPEDNSILVSLATTALETPHPFPFLPEHEQEVDSPPTTAQEAMPIIDFDLQYLQKNGFDDLSKQVAAYPSYVNAHHLQAILPFLSSNDLSATQGIYQTILGSVPDTREQFENAYEDSSDVKEFFTRCIIRLVVQTAINYDPIIAKADVNQLFEVGYRGLQRGIEYLAKLDVQKIQVGEYIHWVMREFIGRSIEERYLQRDFSNQQREDIKRARGIRHRFARSFGRSPTLQELQGLLSQQSITHDLLRYVPLAIEFPQEDPSPPMPPKGKKKEEKDEIHAQPANTPLTNKEIDDMLRQTRKELGSLGERINEQARDRRHSEDRRILGRAPSFLALQPHNDPPSPQKPPVTPSKEEQTPTKQVPEDGFSIPLLTLQDIQDMKEQGKEVQFSPIKEGYLTTGQIIHIMREMLDMSQEELAQLIAPIGIMTHEEIKTMIEEVELGIRYPRFPLLKRIARALGMDVSELYCAHYSKGIFLPPIKNSEQGASSLKRDVS